MKKEKNLIKLDFDITLLSASGRFQGRADHFIEWRPSTINFWTDHASLSRKVCDIYFKRVAISYNTRRIGKRIKISFWTFYDVNSAKKNNTIIHTHTSLTILRALDELELIFVWKKKQFWLIVKFLCLSTRVTWACWWLWRRHIYDLQSSTTVYWAERSERTHIHQKSGNFVV